MLVNLDQIQGTIGGGHLELDAISKARELLRANVVQADTITEHYKLGPTLGQCCGGALALEFSVGCESDFRMAESTTKRFHLQLYGAGHVGQAVVRALERLSCSVQWIDERETVNGSHAALWHQLQSTSTQASEQVRIQAVCVDSVVAEVKHAPAGSAFLVMTHSHDLDLEIVKAVLNRNDYAYLGLIGSATKRARFEHRLRDLGFRDEQLSTLTCPIGVPGLKGKEPEVIAVSVAAQLLSLFP